MPAPPQTASPQPTDPAPALANPAPASPTPPQPVCFTDTMSATLRQLQPRDPNKVHMYVCGPTVYDSPHIGHARTALTYDVIRRYLLWRGYEVRFIMNITDIDDKIINRAAAEGRTEPEVAAEFEADYLEQMDRLGIMRPDEMPHATEYVGEMIDVISELVERDVGYVIEDAGVYFEVAKFPAYGQLVHQDADELLEGSGLRVEIDDRKRSPQDFALWKAAKPGEPSWDSPWMKGRPGWHIECVAMSLSLLGEGFDIHGGGTDLVFPHHENELAQAEAAGHSFAQGWIHSAMVNVGGEKMAKSLQNFKTAKALLDAWSSDVVRLAILQTHYRSTMEISDNALMSAKEGLERILSFVRMAGIATGEEATATPATEPALEPAAHPLYASAIQKFQAAMDNDFQTPKAVAVIFETVRAGNTALAEVSAEQGSPARVQAALRAIKDLTSALGLSLSSAASSESNLQSTATDENQINQLVADRETARANKDFAEADKIRDQLLSDFNVEVTDTPHGSIWHHVN